MLLEPSEADFYALMNFWLVFIRWFWLVSSPLIPDSPKEIGKKTRADADAMKKEHENRTHQFNDGTEQVVEPFIGNRLVRSIGNADQKMKDRLAAREAAGKPPLEGD